MTDNPSYLGNYVTADIVIEDILFTSPGCLIVTFIMVWKCRSALPSCGMTRRARDRHS